MSKMLLYAAVSVLVLTGCSKSPDNGSRSQQPTFRPPTRSGDIIHLDENSPQLNRIRVAAVEAADVPLDEVVAPGKVEMNPGRVSRVALPVAGRVRDVLVVLGDQVRQSQAILTLESPEVSAIQSALRKADADVSQANATLAKAEADLDRARDLLANRATAQKEVLAAETIVAQAKAALEQALAAQYEAQRRARILGLQPGGSEQFITVSAPASGKVTEVAVASGEYRSDTAAPVLTIADLSTVWVAADVPESAIRLIQAGERVSITFPAFPDRTFAGRVTRIGDLVDPETRTIKVRAELSNPRGDLRPEMFAQVRHDHGTRRLPVLPKSAVLQQEGRNIVYVERATGQFQEVPVMIGWQGTDRVAITTGIRPGDRVVIEGAMLLKGAAL
jgi:cobalt-zinc-cadmium efflux system membrane fusion protein